jgi:hypothetical protein
MLSLLDGHRGGPQHSRRVAVVASIENAGGGPLVRLTATSDEMRSFATAAVDGAGQLGVDP